MKKSNVIWGLLLIALGVVFGLNALNITTINIFFTGWWTMFLIIPAIAGIVENKERRGNIILLIVGIILLLSARGILDISLISHLIIPILLIIFGILLILKKDDNGYISSEKNSNDEEIMVTFSNQTITIDEEIGNQKASAVFGKLTLDLTNAKFKKDTKLKLEAVFGNVVLILPEGLDIKVKSTPIFGGVDNSYNKNGSKVIYIDADAVFGGVNIK